MPKNFSLILRSLLFSVFCAGACLGAPAKEVAEAPAYDVVVFGGTPAGVMAAVAAGKAGNKVLLMEPSYIIGGMMAGGLTKTDIGRRETVGGLSIEFFQRVKKYYTEKYGPDSQQVKDSHGGLFFEPHVAEFVFSEMLKEAGVEVQRKQQLVSAEVAKNRLTSIRVKDVPSSQERDVTGKIFIDATYEGDLMAAAKVPYRVGREARSEYGESLAGVTDGPPEYIGTGDHRTQAYNIRSTLTNRDDIRVPVPKPKHYTPEKLEGFINYVNAHKCQTFEDLFRDHPLWGPVNGKSDPNKGDYVGVNYAYAEADYEARAAILERVQDYFLSLWWMLQNDPRLSEEFRASAKKWGLPKDEFVESGHVSPQIYVREARRMLGRYFLKQQDLEIDRHKDDAICIGSYNIDSHTVQQFSYEGKFIDEEGYLTSSVDPYEIPYRSITPIAPSNLLVVCAVSASHVAYGSLRMEPVFMMIGQAAGVAADLALRKNVSVQKVPVKELQAQLTQAGIPLRASYRPAVEIVNPPAEVALNQPVQFKARVLEGKAPLKYFWNFDGSGAVQSTEAEPSYTFTVSKPQVVSVKVVDADGMPSMVAETLVQVGDDKTADPAATVKDARFEGRWDRGGTLAVQNRHRVNFHDINAGKGEKSVTFTTKLPRPGRYLVALAFQGSPDRSTKTPVTVTSSDGEKQFVVNQRTGADPFAFTPLGEFAYKEGAEGKVTVRNEGTDGFVSADAVRWIWLGP